MEKSLGLIGHSFATSCKFNYFEFSQQHIHSKICTTYSKFVDLRQSEISSKKTEILSLVGVYNDVWLHKAAWRAFLFLTLCDKEYFKTNFNLCPSFDILIGLHVIMLDVNWFYDEFLPKNNFSIKSTSFNFQGNENKTPLPFLDLLENYYTHESKTYTRHVWDVCFNSKQTNEQNPNLPFDVELTLSNFPVPSDSILQQFVPPSILGKEIHFLIHIFQTWKSIAPEPISNEYEGTSPRSERENLLKFQGLLMDYYGFLSSIMTTGFVSNFKF